MNTAPRAMTVGHELEGMRPMKAKPSPAAGHGEGHRHRRGELDGGAGDAGDVAGELVEDDHASGAGGRGESHEDAGNRQRALQSGRIQQKQAADHDGESDHHGNPQALLEQEGGQRHGDDRGRGGQNGAEAYAEQAVGSENGHHGEAETGAGEGHEQDTWRRPTCRGSRWRVTTKIRPMDSAPIMRRMRQTSKADSGSVLATMPDDPNINERLQ